MRWIMLLGPLPVNRIVNDALRAIIHRSRDHTVFSSVVRVVKFVSAIYQLLKIQDRIQSLVVIGLRTENNISLLLGPTLTRPGREL